MSSPMTAAEVLDRYFLETRCKLLEMAANLDRIGRGSDLEHIQSDPRLAQVREAISVLLEEDPGRAERIQRIFSLPYDPNWRS